MFCSKRWTTFVPAVNKVGQEETPLNSKCGPFLLTAKYASQQSLKHTQWENLKVKLQFSLCSSWSKWACRHTAPLNLTLSNRRMWAVSFMSQQIYCQRKSPQDAMNEARHAPEPIWQEKSLVLSEYEPQFFSCPTWSPVTTIITAPLSSNTVPIQEAWAINDTVNT